MQKNFTEEQHITKWSAVNWHCENCNKRCGSENEIYPLHHKKKKSQLTKEEIKTLGPGGGLGNAAALCNNCHSKAHLKPWEMEKFNIKAWDKIPVEKTE